MLLNLYREINVLGDKKLAVEQYSHKKSIFQHLLWLVLRNIARKNMKITHTGVLRNERYLKNAIYSMSNVKHFHLTTFVRICLETLNAFLMVSFFIYLLVHKKSWRPTTKSKQEKRTNLATFLYVK